MAYKIKSKPKTLKYDYYQVYGNPDEVCRILGKETKKNNKVFVTSYGMPNDSVTNIYVESKSKKKK